MTRPYHLIIPIITFAIIALGAWLEYHETRAWQELSRVIVNEANEGAEE